MVTLGSTRIRTERQGWFLLLNVVVGEIVVTLWRNAKQWSGADPPCFLVSERDVMQQCRVSEGLDCQGLLRDYVVDVRCLIFLEGANLNSVLELCSIVIWVLVYYTDFLVGICVCAGCNMKSYSHGFISCTCINMLCIQFWVFLFHRHSNSLQNWEFITPHNCPPKLFVVPRQCTLLINQFGYYILLHKSSTDSYSLFVCTWLKGCHKVYLTSVMSHGLVL